MRVVKGLIIFLFTGSAAIGVSQTNDTLLQAADLQACIKYAINHYPGLKESQLDEEF